jgi:hypothetical protein
VYDSIIVLYKERNSIQSKNKDTQEPTPQVSQLPNKSIMLFAVWMMPWCVYKAGVQTGNSTDKGRIRSKAQVEVGVLPTCFLWEKL